MTRPATEIAIIPAPGWEQDKPDETGPCILIHSAEDAAFSNNNPAHAFGPFLNLAEAMAFVMGDDGDDCIKTIMPLVTTPGTIVAEVTVISRDLGTLRKDALN